MIPGGPAVTDLPAGVYRVLVTDVNGCVREQAYTIASNSNLQLDTVLVMGPAPGTASVSVSGGVEPLEYIWCTGQDGPTATGINS